MTEPVGPHTPRTWRAVEEPGPDVRAVRTADGELWQHRADRHALPWEGPDGYGRSWHNLLTFGRTLTDATHELPEENP